MEQYDGQRLEGNRRELPLPPMLQLLVTLWFYGDAAFQVVTGDLINLTQPRVCRMVGLVTRLIARHLLKKLAHFPNASQLSVVICANSLRWPTSPVLRTTLTAPTCGLTTPAVTMQRYTATAKESTPSMSRWVLFMKPSKRAIDETVFVHSRHDSAIIYSSDACMFTGAKSQNVNPGIYEG